jgi:prephenate dehydrogenase
MGSYFTDYFRRLGHIVVGSDLHPGDPGQRGATASNLRAVRQADLVLLAVPIGVTVKVAREIRPALKRGSVLVEIASVKGTTLAPLKNLASSCGASLLSIHPMFGPSSRSMAPKMLVVGGDQDLKVARRFFKRADLTLVRPAEHDRLVAYALSLVHLSSLAFASAVVKGPGLKLFHKSAPPFASAQLNLVKAVLLQGPELYFHIDTENKHVLEALTTAIDELSAMKSIVERKDPKAFDSKFARLARQFRKSDMEASLARVYAGS